MKTTLEIPDDLYREVKSRAALRRRKIKDYVALGLRLALEADEGEGFKVSGPLAVFDEIRACPRYASADILQILKSAEADRKAPWRDEL